MLDKRLPNSEPKLRAIFDKLTANHGTVLVVVDQPASIGALPLAVARDAGCTVAYLPGLTMRRIADLYPARPRPRPGRAHHRRCRTDHAAHPARPGIRRRDDRRAADDRRIRRPRRRSHPRPQPAARSAHPDPPPLERVLGPRADHPAVLTLLERFGSPAQLRKAGRRQLLSLARVKAPRMAERLVDDIFAALDEQTVTVPGTHAAAIVIPGLAASLRTVLEQRRAMEQQITDLLEVHPLSKVLTSMPSIGVGDGSAFPTVAHLVAYAGLAPATRSTGSSIRGEQPSRRGNKQLKRAFFLAAFASLSHPPSRAYYDKKIAQGKRHGQALLCLARRRTDVLFAMLRDGTFYEPPAPAAT